jgi:hypothetical protein
MVIAFIQAVRRGTAMATIVLGLLGLGLVLFAPSEGSAQAAPSAEIKQLKLTGAEENPAVTVNTVGYFSGTLRDGSLEFDLSGDGAGLTMAHLHQGAKGVNGPVVGFLFGPFDGVPAFHVLGTITKANLVGPLAGNWDAFAAALAKGEIYANIHSKDNPGGVARAQIPPTTLTPGAPRTGTGAAGSDWASPQVLGAVLVVFATSTLVLMAARRRRAPAA